MAASDDSCTAFLRLHNDSSQSFCQTKQAAMLSKMFLPSVKIPAFRSSSTEYLFGWLVFVGIKQSASSLNRMSHEQPQDTRLNLTPPSKNHPQTNNAKLNTITTTIVLEAHLSMLPIS